MHGGASTGPRTAAGLARMVAAKTTHGRYAMSGAAERQAQRYVRTLIVRTGLACTATLLRAYLPAGMAARLDAAPEALQAPKHPSQVAFEALHATTPGNSVPAGLGLGRRARAARARLGAGGGVAVGAAAVLRGRETERGAARTEAAAQAPWRAAIKAARGVKRAAWEERRETHNSRNDPMRGAAMGARVAAGAPLGVPAGHQAGDTAGWAPGAPGLSEALAREVLARRLRAELALRGNDPMRGPAAGAAPGGVAQERLTRLGEGLPDGAARVAPTLTGLGPRKALALGSTTLARTWEPNASEILAARFGPAAPMGWPGPPAPPPGIAAMPGGDCAQRPHTGPAAPEPAASKPGVGVDPVGRWSRR